MKKLLLIITLLFSTSAFAQNPCSFTVHPAGAINVFTFTAYVNYPSSQYITEWNFGDGQFAYNDSIETHMYNATGVFVVCCTVYDSLNGGALFCNYCDTLFVPPSGASCSFTSSPDSTPNTVTFGANFSSASSFFWDFGDSTLGYTALITHTFPGQGTYNVCLYVLDSVGTIICTSCNPIVVGNNGGCSFTATPDSANPYLIHFASGASAGSIVTWSFGDGNSGNGINESHLYNGNGPFAVCMVVNNILGSCTYCDSITVGILPGNCAFSSYPDSFNPDLIYFHAISVPIGTGITVTWTFGDGGTGQGIDPHHTYSSSGVYNVCMTQTDLFGTAICTICSSINVNNSSANCSFYSSPDSLNTLLNYFQAASVFPNSVVTWTFGDGGVGQGPNEHHTYSSAGTYTVCMTQTDFFGTVLCTSCDTITVSGNTPGCHANFIVANLALTGYFIDLSNVNAGTATYNWSFGDGSGSTVRFPQHTYSTPGTYTVCLTVNDNGCTDHYCSSLLVDTIINNPTTCQAMFAVIQIAPYQLAVVNLSTGINLNFLWDFGDGATSTQAYPSHHYNNIGTYNLCLTVTDPNPATPCTSTYCDTLSVDSLGNIYRGTLSGFDINVISPANLTSVQEISAAKLFSIYPNPVTSVLNVSITDEMKNAVTYKVYALDGTEVTSGTFTRNQNRLNASDWNAGAYILEVRNADGFKNYQKIIKE